jgi:His Kinase A (phospho-acceptor) domain
VGYLRFYSLNESISDQRIFVRFDDMLATVSSQSTGDSAALAAAWMQTVDIIAQGKGSVASEQRREALTRLTQLRSKVPIERRRQVAVALVARPISADIVIFFGNDAPVVAAPILTTVTLDVEQWRAVLAKLPQPSRALLRERRDLPAAVTAMLSGFGSSDLALPAGTKESIVTGDAQGAPPPSPGMASQISELVARIEAYRSERAQNPLPPHRSESALQEGSPGIFRFETEADGVILWVDGVGRGSIVGINIGLIASAGEHGVDGHAAGAFRKRTPFRDARMLVPGAGDSSGSWLISGTPWFNSVDGRFCGYRCTARRPLREENLADHSAQLLGTGLPPDSVRQLVHELRTPLNAIRGFAEMISGQLLGPVSLGYRTRAQAIIDDSRRLLSLFDDLDSAAKLDQLAQHTVPAVPSNARRLLHGVAANLSALTDARKVHLQILTGREEATLAVEAHAAERMYARLLSTVIGLAGLGEQISADLEATGQTVSLRVDRPASLKGLSEDALLDPGYGPVGEWPDAPALGLGFALRLINNMARAVNGRFVIGDTDFVLRLPAEIPAQNSGEAK